MRQKVKIMREKSDLREIKSEIMRYHVETLIQRFKTMR